MAIHVSFGEVDGHVSMMGGMIAAWEDAILNIERATAKLHSGDFQGDTADAHGTVMSRLDRELVTFKGTVAQLKASIGLAGGTGGEFQTTDQTSRGLFAV
ncbi:hypothetical protein ACIBCD_41360 [Nocardia brasiliensis]